ncbi:ABCH1 / ATP-binding cassette protein subfamily H - member 1 [Leishmania donovani]|uniref:ATP-binding_cassette_protein_subfamily_H_-_member_1_-_putative n=3 Tax=Leishmania donovani species complex TaxID=38574 RepID=A0A6L0WK05_LEIIN|nr:ATP-binding cassette protein subfamily H, member 1 [Leishmania infantum JPCM5]XP_003858982.1 ATP-binding cassette protein subfamily H, member 1, putative [Leishmania donovani]CAC9459554.1 ATP-binding_cassette_protein_subfamily_H_-_member_1_-_putative [Leishmania infantum]AYU76773.1 ATP-binding cassette protein subfamily H, member 1, putative [Leishmania donovani]TPP39794.1 ABC transporter family protein [Leishmania donovani]TPP53083.1 ABC transporter family protein [Leishmania donovani]CAJ|eukprot:XP_001463807.1 ATP-binding cassette protein subfamily H, member 1 [Leishmania infantum JPCM5]
MDPIISCDNIHKTYLLGVEGVPALRGVDVDINPGELLVVYGTSGGGKSTLLNVLGTIDTPTKGNMFLFGKRVTDQTPDSELAAMRCKRIGFVFQSFNLISTMDALGNVSLPMMIKGSLSASDIKKRATALLEEVGLGHRLHHFPSMLSGGEQQRVTIARALANEPEILFLDEPTGDLDTKNTLIIMNILMRLNREHGLTMVMVTHDVYMKQYAHRVIYIRDGKVSTTETVHSNVRERAWNELQKSLRKASTGTGEQKTPTSEQRTPQDYATFSAQGPLNLDEDPEMQQVVDVLFGPQQGRV